MANGSNDIKNKMLMDDKWSDQLRQKLQHHEETVPDDLWNRIECRLEEASKQPAAEKKTKHRPLYAALWSGAAAACALLALWLGGEYGPKEIPAGAPHLTAEMPKTIARNADSKAETPEQETEAPEQKAPIAAAPDRIHHEQGLPETVPATTKEELPTAETAVKEEKQPATESPAQEEETATVRELDRIHFPKSGSSGKSGSTLPDHQPARTAQRWALAMAATQGIPQSQLNYGGQGDINKGKFHTATINGSTWGESHLTDILLYNKNGTPETDINHHQPITGGVKFQYRLNDVWSLESGLTYTLLRSELRSGGNSYFYKTDQRLHLLGIPIKVNYTFWQNKHWQTYAQAGMLFEKDIAGKETTDYYKEKQKVSSDRNDIRIQGLQYTALCGAGIQFNCTHHLGIYAEPGLAWHIVPDKSIQTIYTDKPLNFNIELGMRLSW